MLTRYENHSMARLEALLEKILLAMQNGNTEQATEKIEKCLTEIRKSNDEIKGGDFL